MTIAKPFVKWAGGKTKLLPHLLPHVPEEIETYVEPFVGGGALFFELARLGRLKHVVLNDMNDDLVCAYRTIWRSLPVLLVVLSRHKYEKKHFLEVRAQDPKTLSDVQRAARFIYLNKTCFNGLYRVNKAGKFNVPFGKFKNPTICDEENLRAVSRVLQSLKVEFWNADFEVPILKHARKGTFVYCDPPYDVLSDTSDFTGYTAGGFGWPEQERLERVANVAAALGAKVVLSNADTPRIRKLYYGWRIQAIQAKRAINSDAKKRGPVSELVITQ